MPDTSHLRLFEDKDFPIPETFYDDYETRTEAAKLQDMEIRNMYLSLDMKLLPEYFGTETGTGGLKDTIQQQLGKLIQQPDLRTKKGLG